MNRFRRLSLWALLALASGCAQLPTREPLKVNLVGIEPLPGEGLEMRMAVKLRLQNPNDGAVDFDGAALDIDIRGSGFASGVTDERGSVPRFGETVLVVPVSVSAASMLRQALEFASGDRSNVTYLMRGRLGGSLIGGTRFESSGQVELPVGLFGPARR